MTYAEERPDPMGYAEELDERGPTWTIEEECAAVGHEYHGDDDTDAPDGWGGRCYCGARRYPTGGPWMQHKVSAGAAEPVLSSFRAGSDKRRSAPAEPLSAGSPSSPRFGDQSTPVQSGAPAEQRSAALGSPGGWTIGSSDRTSPAAGTCSAEVVRPHGSGSDPNRTGPPIAASGGHSGDCRTSAGDRSTGDGADPGGAFAVPVRLVDECGPGSSLSKSPGPGSAGAVSTPAPDLPSDLAYWRSRIDEVVRRTAGLYRPNCNPDRPRP